MRKKNIVSIEKKDNMPQHIAIVMDGNRRWAKSKGVIDALGHKAGSETLEEIVDAASKMGIKTLTVYALSSENLQQRAKREISAIFLLMENLFKVKLQKLAKEGVRVTILGELEGLPERIQNLINKTKETYIENETIKLNIALNYGGRKELVGAFKSLLKDGVDLDRINEEIINKHLYTFGQTDPDLVIRTGGRVRLSNFLLWQTAYSELYFSKKLWPDFSEKDLRAAVAWYKKQKRNFGK